MDREKTSSTSIVIAVIGAMALIIVAIITFWKDWTISQLPISATQTAEAKLTQIASSSLTLTRTGTILPVTTTTVPNVTPRPITLASSATPTLGPGSMMTSPVDGATIVCVPAGEFTMGSNDYDDEKPPHTVYLGRVLD